jgi:nifR3 family TIM-barrel protein
MICAQEIGKPDPLRRVGLAALGEVAAFGGAPIIAGAAILAPMSGITDLGMRRAARRFGATLAFSEMVASDEFLASNGEARLRAEGEGAEPHAAQLVGSEPLAMAEAARRLEGSGARLIDINMGCPSRRVSGRLAGCALMRDLDQAGRLIDAVASAVRAPVSVKMRLGWDEGERNAPALARRAEAAGARMITVHGRTRSQMYNGAADWTAVGEVVAAVRAPVVVNGDCRSLEDARAMLAQSGAEGVMIGRAAVGAPWLVGAIARALQTGAPLAEPSAAERCAAALTHIEWLLTALGRTAGLRHARKHLSAYAEKAGAPEALRRALVTSEDADEALRLLARAFTPQARQEAA